MYNQKVRSQSFNILTIKYTQIHVAEIFLCSKEPSNFPKEDDRKYRVYSGEALEVKLTSNYCSFFVELFKKKIFFVFVGKFA